MKLLIVEDSKNISDILFSTLSKIQGVQIVGQKEDPLSAMETIQSSRPDTMILDIQLSGGNGFEVLKFTKKNYPTTKVIILTNYTFPQYREKCNQLGADYFLDKSSGYFELQEIILKMAAFEQPINHYPMN